MEEYRDEINKIDDKILDLLKERFDISKKMGKYKLENNIPVYNPDREKELITRLKSKGLVRDIYVEHIWTHIMIISRNIQKYQDD